MGDALPSLRWCDSDRIDALSDLAVVPSETLSGDPGRVACLLLDAGVQQYDPFRRR
jgi:hypothetical protein